MYNLKDIANKTDKPLRTIQNWFKGVEADKINPANNAKLYKEETVLKVLKEHEINFLKENEENKENIKGAQNDAQQRTTARNDAQTLTNLLEKQISFLQSQLEEKDKQISNLSASLEKSNELLSNEQHLNLLNVKQIEDLRAQLLLDKPKETAETPTEEAETIEKSEEKQKKSFISRLFGL